LNVELLLTGRFSNTQRPLIQWFGMGTEPRQRWGFWKIWRAGN